MIYFKRKYVYELQKNIYHESVIIIKGVIDLQETENAIRFFAEKERNNGTNHKHINILFSINFSIIFEVEVIYNFFQLHLEAKTHQSQCITRWNKFVTSLNINLT